MTPAKCIQCGSLDCGEYVCRFSGITHKLFRENQYAEAMIKRDQEKPEWLRYLLTGGRDIPNGQ